MYSETEIRKIMVDYVTMLYEGKDTVVVSEGIIDYEEDVDME